MAIIHVYFERANAKVLKVHMNNFSYFEISASFFLSATLQ